MSESREERLAKIFKAAEPMLEMEDKPKVEPVKPESTGSSPRKTRTEFDDPDGPTSPKQLAVMKARDEEMRTLLKEGISLWKEKKAEQAIAKFNQVTRLDPSNAEANFSLGVIYEAKGQLEQALTSYKQAHDVNPDRMDYKDAIVVLQNKIKKKGAEAQVDDLAKEAALAFRRKEYMSAMDLYKQLEQKYPNKAIYKYNIGTIYLLMKSPEQALDYYKDARKLAPKEKRFDDAYKKLAAVMKVELKERKKIDEAWADQESGKGKKASHRPASKASPRVNSQPVSSQPIPLAQKPPGQNMNPSMMQHVQPGPTGQPGLSGWQQPPVQQSQMVPQTTNILPSFGILAQQTPQGVGITTVGIGSRAARAGMQIGDIIISLDGIAVNSIEQLSQLLSAKAPTQPAQMIIKRGGQVGQISF